MYIYIYIFIHIHIHVHTHVYVYIYIHVYNYIYIYIYQCTRTCICVDVYIYYLHNSICNSDTLACIYFHSLTSVLLFHYIVNIYVHGCIGKCIFTCVNEYSVDRYIHTGCTHPYLST